MPLQRHEVEHIAALARIALTGEELNMFQDQLSHILEQFQVLGELDTAGLVATGHAADLNTVTREDVPQDCLGSQEVLSNVPRTEGEFIRVKPVLSDSEGESAE